MKQIAALVIVTVLGFAALPAGAAGTGASAANFSRIAVGARPAGMGEAFAAVADESSGMFYNPAGLGFLSSPEIQAMHSLWTGDLSYSYLGYCHPVKASTFGLGLQYLGAPSTPKVVNGVSAGDFNYYDAAANVLYAYRPSDVLSFGLVARSIQSQIDTSGMTAFTGDVGMLFRTRAEGFSFGVAGQNLAGTMGPDPLAATYRAGMAFSSSLKDNFSDILFSLEAGRTGAEPLYYAAGLEHWGGKTLGLRVGYKYTADDATRAALDVLAPWRAGLSLRVKMFQLDYAYQPFAALGETHRLSFTWRAGGWSTKHKRVPMECKIDPRLFSPNKDGAKDSVFVVPEITAINNIKQWTLTVRDAARAPLMTVSGQGRLPKLLTWEGQMDDGGMVGEGKFYAQFTAEGDGRRRAESDEVEIVSDLTPPAVSLQVSNETLYPGSGGLTDGATFYVSATDINGLEDWVLSINNARGKPVKVFTSTSDKPQSVFWDGTDDYYSAVVPNAVYTATLTAMDNAGNRAKTLLMCTVYVEPKVREVIKEVQVKETKKGLVINLSSQVMFDMGKSALKPAGAKALEEVVSILRAYPENNVLIEGYSDSTGSRQKNIELSSSRAWNVYSYLVKQGIPAARLQPKGYGPDKPIASNKTAAGRAKNRRVEITILKQP